MASLFRRRRVFHQFSLQKNLSLKEVVVICLLRFRTILLRLPAPLIIAVLWILSSQSTLPQIKGVFGWDKLQHLLAFAALGAAVGLWFSLVFWNRRPALALLLTTLIGSAYGAIDEFHQYFVPGRDCNVWDWFADTLGALLGALAIMILMKKWKYTKT